MVQPYATAPPNPQLYETDFGPREVLARALTEVWQVKVGDETDAEEKGGTREWMWKPPLPHPLAFLFRTHFSHPG